MLLCGYYGEHNLGDDALLQALLGQLPPGLTPVVTAHDQEEVRRRFAVATVDRRRPAAVLAGLGRCDALVFGGGSLLQDTTSFRSLLYYAALIAAARLRGKPVLLWGQGLGPLRRRRSRALVRALLPLVQGITWRDPDSAELGRRLGRPAPVGSDPVWSLDSQPWLGRGGAIVVCWRPTPLLVGLAWRPYLQALEQLAERGDRAVLWLPFHRDQDTGLLQRLQSDGLVGPALLHRSRELEALDPSAAMAVFREAGLVLAMRLHALILASLAGAPVVALSYDPKVRAAASGLGAPCSDLDAPEPQADVLTDRWDAALDRPLAPEAVATQRAATAVHRDLLRQLIPQHPL